MAQENKTYTDYVDEYESLLRTFLRYKRTEVGSDVYANKLSDLEEAYPQHADRYDDDHRCGLVVAHPYKDQEGTT
jgi:hypothetical protein